METALKAHLTAAPARCQVLPSADLRH